MPLVLPAAVEATYQCAFDTSAEVAAITAMLDQAEAEVVGFLDRVVGLETGRVEVHHVLHADHRMFADERIDGSLVVEERPPGGAYATLADGTDYVVVDQQAGRVHRIFSERVQSSWAVGYNTVRLTYDAGWTTPPIQITQTISEIGFAKYLFSQIQGEGSLIAGALVQERMGDYAIQYGDVRASAGEQSLAGGGIGLSKAHTRLLAPFRRRHVA